MTGQADGQMLSRIGFAERWLNRAKHQWEEGNQARTVLTLVLADAELRHAMEAAQRPTRGRVHHCAPATRVLVAVAVACGLLLVLRWPLATESVATTPARPLFSQPTAPHPMQAFTSPAMSASVRVVPATNPTVQPSKVAAPWSAPKQMSSTEVGAKPAAHVAPASVAMPSMLDLVLTAERVLRQEPAGLASP